MENRISDIGPRKYDEFYPPIIAKNKGKWLYHEIIQPGVLKHVSETGDECYTVRCASARLISTSLILDMCDIADKHCDGFLRFTTRNNVEFMVDSADKVQPHHHHFLRCVDFRHRICFPIVNIVNAAIH